MRSTTFDLVGMTLMAVAVILVCGVMLMYGYVRETRGGTSATRPDVPGRSRAQVAAEERARPRGGEPVRPGPRGRAS